MPQYTLNKERVVELVWMLGHRGIIMGTEPVLYIVNTRHETFSTVGERK